MKLFLAGLVVLVIVLIWTTDAITLEGERTIYTLQCNNGEWKDGKCTGTVTAGDRYRFRALKTKREVLFWTVGASTPSDKYTGCTVRNRDHWSCTTFPTEKSVPPYEMAGGRLRSPGNSAALPLHMARKWRWWLLHMGLPASGSATG
ncbi:MAG: hypothetical protein ABJC33_01210 [Betaproteobacteria bacterium]